MTQDTNTYPRSFVADRPLDVKVEIGGGHVSLTATGTNEAVVTLRPARSGDDEELDLIARSTVDLRGTSLYIDVPRRDGFHRQAELVVEATVPEMSTANVKTGSAGVQLTGEFRDIDVRTGSGDVRLETGGNVKVGTGSGDVSLGRVDDARVKTGSGDISVDAATGELTLSTGSGDVWISEQDATANVTTASGEINVGTSSGVLGVKTASGDVNVRRALAGEVGAKTASGRVVVGVPEGTATLLDCSSVSGKCRSGLTPTDAPDEGDARRLQVSARTVSGNINITRSK